MDVLTIHNGTNNTSATGFFCNEETRKCLDLRISTAQNEGYESTIKAVLIDAEEQEKQLVQRSETYNVWLEKLKGVICEADDLFDKVATVATREALVGGKLWFFPSRPMFIFSASREIKGIREILDAIAKDHHDFCSYGLRKQNSVDHGEERMVRKAREESHSYVRDENVAGRKDDRKALIDMLLDPSVEDVSFVTIVGMGGLGKTTLSQLAYNDARIQREFTQRLWVCVSQDFNVKSILFRILELLTDKRYDLFGMEQLRIKLEQEIKGKRYLLVLDDLWNENREEWLQLRDLLIEGGRGSRILVTTRSHMVARVVGNGPTYVLEGLSPKDSWCLFERMAFVEGEEHLDNELSEIGKEIITRCVNIPLAIRVVSSLLYGQDKSKWRHFRDIDLIQLKQEGVLSVLKLSYYHLDPPLKSCFNYCAMFPVDYVIEKKTLIRLWIAQGFIAVSNGQSAEENGEEYFMTLLYRGFFQDVVRDIHGEIISCKIPAVMHNLAHAATKLEVLVANSGSSQFNGQLRHLSVEDPSIEVFSWIASYPKESLRTFFQLRSGGVNSSMLKNFILNGRCLRVLDFRMSSIRNLPSLKNLLHLRYLDLSCNYGLQVLPSSLAKLYNLQTLKLNSCCELKELPRGLSKLINLKVLEIDECFKLTHMPPRISNLTSLRILTMFVVGQTGSQKQANVSDLNELKALINLTGSLTIVIRSINTYTAKDARYLTSMSHLSHICIIWDSLYNASDGNGYSEALLNGLKPHCNLRSFHMRRYPGVRYPSWYPVRNLEASLHKLVEISLFECTWLQYLPSMCHLPSLKTIELVKLDNLEYIKNSDDDTTTLTSASSHDSSFFPALEMLTLKTLPKLKGWQRSSRVISLVFPRLLVLQVWNCPLLTSIPLCQKVEDIELIKFNENFCPFSIGDKKIVVDSLASVSTLPKLKRLMIDNLGCLHFWPVESLQQICYMEMYNSEQESLSTGEKVFRSCLTSLQSLDIFCWKQLRTLLGGGLEHLTALETLRFLSVHSLSMNAEDVRPWKSFHHSLRSLELCDLPMLVDLPKGMQYLTALRSLSISECRRLQALPEWISCLCSLQFLNIRDGRLQSLPKAMQDLTSLRSLVIDGCSARFKARCRAPSGEDWPQIQHIPRIDIV